MSEAGLVLQTPYKSTQPLWEEIPIVITAFSASITMADHLNKGNKCILPHNILNYFGKYEIPNPLILKLRNTKEENKIKFCGVDSFDFENEICVVPDWIFSDLNLTDGNSVEVSLIREVPTLNKCFFQPFDLEILSIPDIKESLEISLKNYICLTKGEDIYLEVRNKNYKIRILDISPLGHYKCGKITDTDLEVIFLVSSNRKEVYKIVEEDSVTAEKKFQNKVQITANGDEITVIEEEEDSSVEYDPRKFKISTKTNYSYHGEGIKMKHTQNLSPKMMHMGKIKFDVSKIKY